MPAVVKDVPLNTYASNRICVFDVDGTNNQTDLEKLASNVLTLHQCLLVRIVSLEAMQIFWCLPTRTGISPILPPFVAPDYKMRTQIQ